MTSSRDANQAMFNPSDEWMEAQRTKSSMTDREIMQKALEALEGVAPYADSLICYASTIKEHPPNAIDGKVQAAIAALRQRLARQECAYPNCAYPCPDLPDCNDADQAAKPRQWQGLTDAELRKAYIAVSGNEWCLGGMSNAEVFYEAVEAKLREKNGGAA